LTCHSPGNHSGNSVDPNLRSPYVTNWTSAIQREVSRYAVLEMRHVGNKHFETGFLKQFQQAPQNLAINRNNE